MRFARPLLLAAASLLLVGCSTTGTDCCCNAPVVTYSAPVVVESRTTPRHVERALQPAPTLPCAPGYCAPRKARRDRN